MRNSFWAIVVTAAVALAPVAGRAEGVTTDAARIVAAVADQDMSVGEIRKVDPAAKKITIRHGELKNLEMPAMTMVFQVKDPAMVDKVKAGDRVKFRADKVNGVFIVVEIEVVN